MKRVTILEPGAWGTTLGILLGIKNEVRFWYEKPALALKIAKLRENDKLPGVKIPQGIFISSDLKKVLETTDLIIVASPTFHFRETLLKLKGIKNLPILGIAKGIEKGTLKLPSQIVEEILKEIPYAHLSGPGFAGEVARGKPAKEVIASKNRGLLKWLRELFKVESLKILTTTDLIGVQLAGALKNVLSIGIGLAVAACKNPGPKSIKTDLIQLGLEEMVKLGEALGAKKETFLGPAGLGDLILTSGGPLSRNFQFGKELLFNADKIRKEIGKGKITVEGFDTAFALHKLAKSYKLHLPMTEEIYKVIYKKTSPEKTIRNLIKITEVR